MATTKQAAPAKKSEGFQGVRGAFWIIVVCAIIAFTLFFTWFGNDMHFQDPGVQDHPADIGVLSTKVVLSYQLSTLCCSQCWL